MTTRLPDASQQAAADAVVDRIDVGTTNPTGRLRVYDDSAAAPTDADDAVPGGSVLLAAIPLADPAYGDADSSGTAALQGTPVSVSAVASGTAAWFRIVSKDETTVCQGDVRASGDADNGEELVLDNTSIASGQTVEVSSLDYTHPANET